MTAAAINPRQYFKRNRLLRCNRIAYTSIAHFTANVFPYFKIFVKTDFPCFQPPLRGKVWTGILDGSVPFGYDEKKEAYAVEDKEFMQQALQLAREAASYGEVPVGCVIVRNGEVVGRGRNRRVAHGNQHIAAGNKIRHVREHRSQCSQSQKCAFRCTCRCGNHDKITVAHLFGGEISIKICQTGIVVTDTVVHHIGA